MARKGLSELREVRLHGTLCQLTTPGRARADKYSVLRLRTLFNFEGALRGTADVCHFTKRSLRSDQAICDNLILAAFPSGITLRARPANFTFITFGSCADAVTLAVSPGTTSAL